MSEVSYKDVTEMTGEEISAEQLQRICNRYYWAGEFIQDKDVIEVACGAGAGLGYLASKAKSVRASDISDEVLAPPRAHYGERVQIDTVDATKMPYADASADVMMIFEALYYVPDVPAFLSEVKRVLRPGGVLLIATANKDLYDFNPSPFSHNYYGASDLPALLKAHGLEVSQMAAGTALDKVSWRQRVLRPIKKIVVSLGLMPKTMAGKKLLKRLVFGAMVAAPAEIAADTCAYEAPQAIEAGVPCRDYKVIYCAARA